MARRFHTTISKLDMYRKVPTDLMEGTKRGSMLSYIALMIMTVLFVLESKSYFWDSTIVRDLSLDRSEDQRLRINLNITMMDLKCEWAVIDVVSALGTDQNVTAHITKWNIDSKGLRKIYRSRNRNQRDVTVDLYDTTVMESIESLHENGQDAVPLNSETFPYALRENDYVFVDFYASWCNHCRDLAPTWETLAELMTAVGEQLKEQQQQQIQQQQQQQQQNYSQQDLEAAKTIELPVMIAKIDCVEHATLCHDEQNIRAYPTLRLFVDGQPWKGGDYRGHRTILEMIEWLYHVEEDHKSHMNENERQMHIAHQAARQRLAIGDEDESDEEKKWHDAIIRNKKRLHYEWKEQEHVGCQLSGHLLVDRTPGNFHIQARSSNQEFVPQMTNVSHMVHSLTIGDPMVKHIINTQPAKRQLIPSNVLFKIAPMDGNVYVNTNFHESYHHYLKLVSTQVEHFEVGKRQLRMFQIMENSQISYYDHPKDFDNFDVPTQQQQQMMIPEAKFAYDLSPIMVSYRTQSQKQWYDYCTSIMAIIGGVFTIFGMLEATIQATISTIQHRRHK